MILAIRNISKQFHHSVRALDGVSFTVDEGEFVSVIGPSGSGKTTLLRILNGAEQCDAGEVLLSGAHLERAKGGQLRKLQKSIGTIYQDFALVENVSTLQNVMNAALPDMAFLPAVCGFFGNARRTEAAELLKRVGLGDKREELVCNLSGGQKQRVAIARALMRHPKLLLADEPVASLDPVIGRQILVLLREIQKTEGLTVLMNSHNLALSLEFSDRLIGLRDGRVVYDGSAAGLTEEDLAFIYQERETA